MPKQIKEANSLKNLTELSEARKTIKELSNTPQKVIHLLPKLEFYSALVKNENSKLFYSSSKSNNSPIINTLNKIKFNLLGTLDYKLILL